DVIPERVAELLRGDPSLRLLDVRTEAEWELARIEGAELVTPALAREILEEWGRDAPIVLYCHHGIRSRFAAHRLIREGFTRVLNMAGGIDRWSLRVDPSVPRYGVSRPVPEAVRT
ncbi:MAG: rhodanese-like domain-containing protein, partial [Planctomycetota bacterium]